MATIILMIVGVWCWFFRTPDYGAKTTSKQASAQNDYKGDARHTTDGQATNTNQGGAIDNKGDKINDNAAGISSQSGIITVLAPSSNQVVSNGSILRGRANNVPEVQYRLADDNVGVIAQGTLQVINDTFSGVMQFKSSGANGRVDIFTYNQNYNEDNSVQIPVRFKD